MAANKTDRARRVRVVREPVTNEEGGGPAGPGREGGGAQGQVAGPPFRGWDRQIVPLQGLRRRHVGPGDEPAVDEEEGLDGEGPLVDLHHALLVEQGLGHILPGPDRSPVGLPSQEVFGIEAGPGTLGDGAEKVR